jgi:dihydroorotate dehydrogenase
MDLYSLLRPLFFKLDAETAHTFAVHALALTPTPLLRALFQGKGLPRSSRRVFGLDFKNPIGLAAGMDKNAEALPAWEALGFGFVEIGTITALAQPGNPKPRAFRYPDKKALINRMGFNNDGSEAIAHRLTSLKASGRWPKIPVGINLGKSKVTPLEKAPEDYLASLKALKSFGDYFVINVSSPNTPGLRELQAVESLRQIITALRPEIPDKPLLVKIAPDLIDEQVEEIAVMAEAEGLSGLIATNTTLDHSSIPQDRDQQGGLSGAPLTENSTRILKLLKSRTKLPIIASGGVMTASDGKAKLEAGADLVQIYTGFVYRGPNLITEIAA